MARLDETHVDLIQSGVSIVAASRDSNHAPVLARATGCRVSGDRRQVTLLFSKSSAAPLLDLLRDGAPIAVVYSRPSTHYSIQLKAPRATLSPIEENDPDLVARFVNDFVADVCPLGYREHLIRILLCTEVSDLIAVTFQPEAAFLQSPGPRAGEPLKGGR